MAHDHHDHSNCNHDHSVDKLSAATSQLTSQQRAVDKLAKALVEMQELANLHKKSIQDKPTSNEPVNKADVELLMKEFCLTKAEAEKALRANKSDLVATITELIKA
ncbi:hypothetical protein BDF20DRAFT_900182 [Mycotypha africana]|uniref:uncharacterized protein n=1 Tax=Mycotypha africana TaxID=64632 RepID=UPI002301A4D2|nr:uncharacterized protein BDF20DRAFT_900182 [Mycotypha africana]KAI8967582.1 hypothetical protein BDF20DRAFT_900182 [Mycotypha africana]